MEKLKEMLDPEFIQLIMVFLRIYNPLFDQTSEYLITEYRNYLQTLLNFFAIDFAIMVFLVLVALLVLTKYFAQRIEMEIFIARGIITLLPERLLKSGSIATILKEGQQLSR